MRCRRQRQMCVRDSDDAERVHLYQRGGALPPVCVNAGDELGRGVNVFAAQAKRLGQVTAFSTRLGRKASLMSAAISPLVSAPPRSAMPVVFPHGGGIRREIGPF